MSQPADIDPLPDPYITHAERPGQLPHPQSYEASSNVPSLEYANSNLAAVESANYFDPRDVLQPSFQLMTRETVSRSTDPQLEDCQTTECKVNAILQHASATQKSPHNEPHILIVEQPAHRIRYRYRSEKGSHGGLTGENNSQAKKTYPTVRLENYFADRDVVIKASLVTSDDNPKPHVHKLMGKNCTEGGNCFVTLGQDRTAVFQNLGILFVGKKEVPDILFQRKMEELLSRTGSRNRLTDDEENSLREEAEREAKEMNLNSVRIGWEAFDCQAANYRICPPVYSRCIANQKSPDSGELKIVRMDRSCGTASGNEEVFLLCEKVNRKEIKVRFFEADKAGSPVWESFASFSESDVHHQVAIVFRTPPYRIPDISHPVQVQLQLFRKKDGECSEARSFTYFPGEAAGRKRRCFQPAAQQFMFQGQSGCEAPAQTHDQPDTLFTAYSDS